MSEFLDRLLKAELPNVQKDLPTRRFTIDRLAELAGEGGCEVELRGLPYGRVQELRELERDQSVQIVLAGCRELKELASSPELQKQMGTATPVDTLKAVLLPGEIEDLGREVEKLCGYRRLTIHEVKNG